MAEGVAGGRPRAETGVGAHPIDPDVDVAIIGAGPVGLAAGVLAARFGLSATVLDREEAPSPHPKARGLRLRASEILYTWGLEPELRELAAPAEAQRFIYCESLAGREIARTSPPRRSALSSPVRPLRVPQNRLAHVLEDHLEQSTTHVQRRVELTGIRQADDRVDLDLVGVETGAARQLSARWVVAADGLASTTRGLVGIDFTRSAPVYWQSVFWKGDLTGYTAERPAILYFTLAGDRALVGIGSAGTPGEWVTFVQHPASATRPVDLTDDEAAAITRRAVGVPDLAVGVISTATFRVSGDIAATYRKGNVFLAGDSAHTFPPTGGFGINTGISDVHNLIWKIAAVKSGAATASLLDSYSQERRPVALSNAEWSAGNAARFDRLARAMQLRDYGAIERAVDDQTGHVDPLRQDIGFSYRGAPEDAIDVPRVGARFPFVPLREGKGPDSTLAALEGGFTLVTWARSEEWAAVLVTIAPTAAVPIGQLALDAESSGAPDEGWTGASAALVRPDGHIAWLADSADALDASVLRRALDTTLAFGLATPPQDTGRRQEKGEPS